MTLEDVDLTTDGLQALGDREAIGACFEDQQILARGVPRRPRAERLQRLAGDALRDARLERIAPLKDRRGEGVRMEWHLNKGSLGSIQAR